MCMVTTDIGMNPECSVHVHKIPYFQRIHDFGSFSTVICDLYMGSAIFMFIADKNVNTLLTASKKWVEFFYTSLLYASPPKPTGASSLASRFMWPVLCTIS